MAVENESSTTITTNTTVQLSEDDGGAPLPGFRFHPTDEELVGYYLRRKVEKKPLRIELIKQEDIYKYDPWDLPKTSINSEDKEWYFFCKRGRKYKNSIRPNRVTGSGFWKATGIDRPIYSSGCDGCIGLKKSLVYYMGSSGKGTKTEWMMHEFRLPPPGHDNKEIEAISIAQDAVRVFVCKYWKDYQEVWTLCRILKRSSRRKCLPDWKEVPARRPHIINPTIINLFDASSSETCSVESGDQNTGQSSYISFVAPMETEYKQKNLYYSGQAESNSSGNHQLWGHFSSSPAIYQAPPEFSPFLYGDSGEMLKHADWEDLRSIVNCATTTNAINTTTTDPFCS